MVGLDAGSLILYSLQISLFVSLAVRDTVCVSAVESPLRAPELCSEEAAGKFQIPTLRHRPTAGQKGSVFASVNVSDLCFISHA